MFQWACRVRWRGPPSMVGAVCGDWDRVVDNHGLGWFLMYDILMGCISWYGYLGDRRLLGWDIVEDDNDFKWGKMYESAIQVTFTVRMTGEELMRNVNWISQGRVYMMLGKFRGWSHELGGSTLHSGEGNMLNKSVWALGAGRPGDITRHLPVYISGWFVEENHHSIITSSIKEFYSAWMSLHDGWNSGEKFV